jgi:hypothetical protein
MNQAIPGAEAVIRFLDGDFEIIRPGTHVICALSGDAIALEDLRYWSVDRQEAYRDAEASFQAFKRCQDQGAS